MFCFKCQEALQNKEGTVNGVCGKKTEAVLQQRPKNFSRLP